MKTFKLSLASLILCLVLPGTAAAAPLDATLTYQGSLDNGGAVAEGDHDFRFRLFDDPNAGMQIGPELEHLAVPVSEGVFTVHLDFGSGPFSSDEALWLEVDVRDPAGGGYVTLAPRQPVRATPFALLSLGTADGAVDADSLAAQSVTTAAIAPGAVGASQVDPSQVQQRIAGTCAPGSAMRQVAEDGGVTCEALSASGWRLGGNTGIDPASDWLGTTDGAPVEIRANGQRVLRLGAFQGALDNGALLAGTNILGGWQGNQIAAGTGLAVIAGGGGTVDPGTGVLSAPNLISASIGSILGGIDNRVEALAGSIGGGESNIISGEYSVVAGGAQNTVLDQFSVIGGGLSNQIGNRYSFVGGGRDNEILGLSGFIGAGVLNISDNGGAVLTGNQNTATGRESLVGNGVLNDASADYSVVLSGQENTASASYSFVATGRMNVAQGRASAIVGGERNDASGESSLAAGGSRNSVSGMNSAILGGVNTTVDGLRAASIAGRQNTVTGDDALVLGGFSNHAGGDFSLAAGSRARVRDADTATFVWADLDSSTPNPFESTGSNQFLVRARGGVGLNTNAPQSALHVVETAPSGGTGNASAIATLDRGGNGYLQLLTPASSENGVLFGDPDMAETGGIIYRHTADVMEFRTNGNITRMSLTANGHLGIGTASPGSFHLAVNGNAAKPGGGSWATLSDARVKRDIRPMAGTLDRLLELQGVTFAYSTAAGDLGLPGRHAGFIAQEVATVFPEWVSTDDRGYRYLTLRGFEATAVEALRELRAEKDREIDALKKQVEALARRVERLAAERAQDEP